MNSRIFLPLLLLCCCATGVRAQRLLETSRWEMAIASDGCIERIVFKAGERRDTIPFFRGGANAGPSFYVRSGDTSRRAVWSMCGEAFRAQIDGVECELHYLEHRGAPAFRVRLTNRRPVPFQPTKAGIKLGIDTYMDSYPAWFGKYFPTLMRNERSHFYGYLQNPRGDVLALVCEQPVASWSVDYSLGYQDPAPHWFMGHRIESLNIDLLNARPLPARHPQDLWELKAQESREWTCLLVRVGKLDDLERAVREAADIPMIRLGRTSCRPGEKIAFTVLAAEPEIWVTDGQGGELAVTRYKESCGEVEAAVMLPRPGLYTVSVRAQGFQAEALLCACRDWRESFGIAREAVLRYHQKPTSHAESWYGFYTGFLAARYFPEPETDRRIAENFEALFAKLHDTVRMVPVYHASRIQNTSTTIGMLVDKYEAYGEIGALRRAARLADWLIGTWQRADGAYCNHGTVYTSVIYVAKSILELAEAERAAAREDPAWAAKAERHYVSAKRAVDQLVEAQGNFETEGEHTFEDGMVSCSALQIGILALMQEEAAEREHYTQALLGILRSHDCLTQLRVPDARRRQGTMRFWEAQYDVLLLPDMFNSPHGWSAWRTYAVYYAYLLTGDEKWLAQVFDAMGAFANLIDYDARELRWAFVLDPYVEAEQACEADARYDFSDVTLGNPHPRLYQTRHFVFGEEYVPMISDWQTVNSQDNDVHEVFKCMAETVLVNAFVVERSDGSLAGYNCRVERRGKRLVVVPAEEQVIRLHCNLQRACPVEFRGAERRAEAGAGWLF